MLKNGFTKSIDKPFEVVVEKIKQELQKEGFGVLTSIDLREKFKEKLGIDFHKYVILGACNPPFAHKAVTIEKDIGLMLPCNVVVYEKDGKTVVSIIKPTVAMSAIENEKLLDVAQSVEQKLKKVFESI
jgi:uncharacterized protein (DUF302 family)